MLPLTSLHVTGEIAAISCAGRKTAELHDAVPDAKQDAWPPKVIPHNTLAVRAVWLDPSFDGYLVTVVVIVRYEYPAFGLREVVVANAREVEGVPAAQRSIGRIADAFPDAPVRGWIRAHVYRCGSRSFLEKELKGRTRWRTPSRLTPQQQAYGQQGRTNHGQYSKLVAL